MPERMRQELKIGGIYRHYKGDCYVVEALVKDSNTGEECVLYRALYEEGSLWVRPRKEFESKVEGEEQDYRFELQEVRSMRNSPE